MPLCRLIVTGFEPDNWVQSGCEYGPWAVGTILTKLQETYTI